MCDLHFKNQSKSEVGPDPLNEKKYDAINNQYLIEKKKQAKNKVKAWLYSLATLGLSENFMPSRALELSITFL